MCARSGLSINSVAGHLLPKTLPIKHNALVDNFAERVVLDAATSPYATGNRNSLDVVREIQYRCAYYGEERAALVWIRKTITQMPMDRSEHPLVVTRRQQGSDGS